MGGDLTPENVRASIKMPPELQRAYDAVVLTGMKTLFSKESAGKVVQMFKSGSGSVSERLGRGIAAVMLSMYVDAKGAVPGQVLIPAGMDLLAQAADFIKKANLDPMSVDDIGAAMHIMITTILEKCGIDPKKLMAMTDQYDRGNVQAAQQQMAQPAPQGQPMQGA